MVRAAEAVVGFLGKAILVFRFEGKELLCRVGEKLRMLEVKVSANGKLQNLLIVSFPITQHLLAICCVPGAIPCVFTCSNSFDS